MDHSHSIAPVQKDKVPAAQVNGTGVDEMQMMPEPALNGRPIQFKLSVGAPDDPLEHEADAMADRVMRMPSSNFVQRKCAHCEEEEKVQRRAVASSITPYIQAKGAGGDIASDSVASQIEATRGRGSSIDRSVQFFMENSFGADFSKVNIHTGDYAVQMSNELNAQAFTVGSDIYFNEGKYNPSTDNGKHLLAHELTHTVQQQGGLGSARAKLIQMDRLDDLARTEATAGNTALGNALSHSIRSIMPFNFSTSSLDGSSRITVRQGEGIEVTANASVTGSTTPGGTYSISLMQEVFGSDVDHGIRHFTTGTVTSHSWSGLPAGVYYFHFAKTVSGQLSGNVWVDVLSGAGSLPVTGSGPDSFETSTGIGIGAAAPGVSIAGVAYGAYVLRSEPVPNSFIFGRLPGVPTNITVVDKRALQRDGTDNWYKIQFNAPGLFARLALSVPPSVGGGHARDMYNSQQAWITETALKLYIPYSSLLVQLRNFEADPAVAALTVPQRITMLRQLHQDTNLPYDDIIGTPHGSRTAATRPELSNLIQLLRGPATGVIAPDGSTLDFAHVLITLDAYSHADRNASYDLGMYTGISQLGIGATSLPIGSSRAVMSWSGDVGGAIGNYALEHERRGLTALDTALLNSHFERSAPDADLLGNLDGLGAQNLLLTSRPPTLEGLVRLYYEGITGPGATAVPNAMSNNRRDAVGRFLASYGFTSTTGLTTVSSARNCIINDARLFGNIWYRRGSGFSFSQVNMPTTLLQLVTEAMCDLFLHRLENFAITYGLTVIPPGISRAVTCPAPVVTPVPGATAVPTSGAGSVPAIRRKMIRSFTPVPLIQKQNGGHSTATPAPSLHSIIFRQSDALMAAYAAGTVSLSPRSGSAASVILLQQAFLFLDKNGPVQNTNGIFDAHTTAAVSAFQSSAMGISAPTGIVDAATLGAIDNAVQANEASSANPAPASSAASPARFADYPSTYISRVDVDLSTQTISLTWTGPTAATRPTGPFNCSTGVGMLNQTCFNCDDVTVSNTTGTDCTPKGSFKITGHGNSLPSFPEALFVSFFVPARGVAFHYYPNVPGSPASHGCVRLHLYPAILLYNNVRTGVTDVNVTGTWSRSFRDRAMCTAWDMRRRAGQTLNDAGDALHDMRERAGRWINSW